MLRHTPFCIAPILRLPMFSALAMAIVFAVAGRDRALNCTDKKAQTTKTQTKQDLDCAYIAPQIKSLFTFCFSKIILKVAFKIAYGPCWANTLSILRLYCAGQYFMICHPKIVSPFSIISYMGGFDSASYIRINVHTYIHIYIDT